MSQRMPYLVGMLVLCVTGSICLGEDDLRERLRDENGVQTDVWVYNDIAKGMAEARRLNKPIFVTFRCVPCKDCAAFDADVANGNQRVRAVAKEKFVSVRQVEMKGVDLSLFQFDHDLNWAGMFINADGVVYARYGTQSAEGSDAYNSIDGLLNTMNRVLELHANYPQNLAELKDKRGKPRPVSDALELPGLRNPAKYAQQTERSNCIHCHNIHDAEYQAALNAGTYSVEMLYKYPLPDNIGLKIDRTSGVKINEVVAGSAAAKAGLKPDAEVLRINGQRIASIADMQWVLHNLPNADTKVEVETAGGGKHTVALKPGWKKSDFSWRGSMWSAPPSLKVWAPALSDDAAQKLGIADGNKALEVRWINRGEPAGKAAFDAGLREKDYIVAVAGQPITMDIRQFQMHVKLNYKVGDLLPLTVLRDGRKQDVKIRLVE